MSRLVVAIAFVVVAVFAMKEVFGSKGQTFSFQAAQKILCFGDSITRGYGASSDQSYPSILARLSAKTVINAGINGETTTEGLSRFGSTLDRYGPDIVILCEGGNDMLQGVDEARIKANLKAMIKTAQAQGVEVVLIAVPRLGVFGLSDHPLYEALADDTEAVLIEDILSDILSDPSLKSDQIHPNAEGYRRLAQRVYEVLSKF